MKNIFRRVKTIVRNKIAMIKLKLSMKRNEDKVYKFMNELNDLSISEMQQFLAECEIKLEGNESLQEINAKILERLI